MARKRPLVVFSDVDGVFDGSSPASLAAAAKALTVLSRDHVPLVLCSSKTRAELEYLSRELGISHPFICEHGSAVFIPRGYLGFVVPDGREVAGYQAVEFGDSYTAVVDGLHQTAARLRIDVRGFSDMSVEEVARECHLSLLQARLAKLREYGECFRVLDPHPTARPRLVKALTAARLLCTMGRLYDHVGAAVDHRLGVGLLCGLYRRACGEVISVGLADARGEVNLLQLVDVPVVVRTRDAPSTSRVAREWSAAAVADVVGVEEWVDTIVEVAQESRHRSVASAVD